MSDNYVCPKCGAQDSSRCDFRIVVAGTVAPSQRKRAHEAGCRVEHYTREREAGEAHADT